ncbi:MAG TPA: cyclodeaminase/cyclohydrolase family protein [Anaerolineae bacterium]|nr:cyclodeaminase/cyclohydrolase family protein [Anaerolineae bacterium]
MDENIAAFLKVLDPQDNSTGGGTASAVAGAMAGALVAMVARLSIGKPGMEPEPFHSDLAAAAQALSAKLLAGGREDSEAFEAVRAAYGMPKATDEEKAVRSRAVQCAWLEATRVPLRNADLCASVLGLAALLEGRSNASAASDLECATYLARAGLLGCIANVEINLSTIKDEDVAARLAERAYELRALVA